MPQVTTAGRLLQDLDRVSHTTYEAVVRTAGITSEQAGECMAGVLKLKLSEQLRVAEATMLISPEHTRAATRLRTQALAARSFENGEVAASHSDAPVLPWEREANLRR